MGRIVDACAKVRALQPAERKRVFDYLMADFCVRCGYAKRAARAGSNVCECSPTEIERLSAELADLKELLGPITLCETCSGTGKMPGPDTAEYPASGCCPIGHAKTCQCLVCQWRRAGYKKSEQLRELRAELAELKVSAKADEERLRQAAQRAGIEWYGCDTPEHLADEIVTLRAELADAKKDGDPKVDWELFRGFVDAFTAQDSAIGPLFLAGWNSAVSTILGKIDAARDAARKEPTDAR